MLGKTAGGIYWMFRLLERSENTARLVEAGFRIALTRSQDAVSEWESVITTAGLKNPMLLNMTIIMRLVSLISCYATLLTHRV